MRTKPRRFQGLENLRSAIDLRETDWRIANGEDPEKVKKDIEDKIGGINKEFEDFAPRRPSRIAERTPAHAEQELPEEPKIFPGAEISHEQTESDLTKKPKFSADRFLGASPEPVTPSKPEAPEITSEPEPEADNEPEAAEIIPNKEGRHSWLYNEVMKAINDAAKGSSAKIIAVFIPVVQNGKELEDLPAAETVTTSPIDISLAKIESSENESPANFETLGIESSAKIEAPGIESPIDFESPGNESPAEFEAPENESPSEDFNLIPEIQPEQKAEIAETFREMEEKLDDAESEAAIISEDSEPEAFTQDNAPDFSQSEETVTVIEESEPEISEEESAIVTEDSAQEFFTDESESEALTGDSEPEIFTDESDSAIVTEDSADYIDTLTEESEPGIMKPEDEAEYEVEDDDDILQDGEPMEYEEISTDESTANESEHEELVLTDELDDDEIFDESLTEVHKADDYKAIIVEEDGIFVAPDDDDEIEIIPDPKR